RSGPGRGPGPEYSDPAWAGAAAHSAAVTAISPTRPIIGAEPYGRTRRRAPVQRERVVYKHAWRAQSRLERPVGSGPSRAVPSAPMASPRVAVICGGPAAEREVSL